MTKKTANASPLERAIHSARNSIILARRAIAAATQDGGPELLEGARSEGRLALENAHELQMACGSAGEFSQALQEGVGLDQKEADVVREALKRQGETLKSGAVALAAVPEEGISTQALREALRAYCVSPGCRQHVAASPGAPLRGELSRKSFFYAFNEYLLSDAAPAWRAEALGKIILYVESGKGAEDLAGPLPADPKERKLVEAARQLFARIRQGVDVDEGEIWREFGALLSQRFESVWVSSRNNEAGGKVHLAHGAASLEGDGRLDGLGGLAGAGRIDAVIRDAHDPSGWHIGVFTPEDDVESRKDQLPRHAQAIHGSIARAIPPFKAGDHIASIHFCSAAKLYTDRAAEQISGGFVEKIEGGLSEAERANINATIKISALASINGRLVTPPGLVLKAVHHAFGGDTADIGGFDKSPEALTAEAAEVVASVIHLLATRGNKIKDHSEGEISIPNAVLRAADGLASLFPELSEQLEPLIRAQAAIGEIADRYDSQGAELTCEEWLALRRDLSAPALDKSKTRNERAQSERLSAAYKATADDLAKQLLGSHPDGL